MAPPWLITASLLISIVAGIALIRWARELKDSGPLFTLKLWGQSLKATRPLMQSVFGALLIASPMILNANTKPLAVPIQTATRVTEVSHINDPDYRKVIFRRDLSHLDLRSIQYAPWYMVLPGARQIIATLTRGKIRTNPGTLTNYLWLQKRSPIANISFKYSTRGKIDIRCLTNSYELQHATTPDKHDKEVLRELEHCG